MLVLGLRLLHLMFMGTWIGALLFVSGDVKRTLAEPAVHIPLLRNRIGRATRFAAISGLMTIVTGICLIFALGGFGSVPPTIHTGILMGLAMLGVGVGMIGGSWKKIVAGLDAGASPDSLLPLAKKMTMGMMVFHLLWLVTLGLMVFRNGLG